MDKRVVGTLQGIAGMLLWFMPWMEFSMVETPLLVISLSDNALN